MSERQKRIFATRPKIFEDRGISRTIGIMSGIACIDRTRLPIRMFRGYTWQEFKRATWLSYLSDEQIKNALRYWDVRGVHRDWPGKVA